MRRREGTEKGYIDAKKIGIEDEIKVRRKKYEKKQEKNANMKGGSNENNN